MHERRRPRRPKSPRAPGRTTKPAARVEKPAQNEQISPKKAISERSLQKGRPPSQKTKDALTSTPAAPPGILQGPATPNPVTTTAPAPAELVAPKFPTSGPVTMVQSLVRTLHESMSADPRIVVLGEDIAKNGGVFRVTEGLFDAFGETRVIDTPLNESGIIGVAIGMAMNGLRPIAEIQFADFVYPGFDQIVSELSKMRYRSGGEFTCPVIVRMPYGGGIRGGGYHSQSPEAYFVHTAGLHVYVPSTPTDARGLLRAALAGDDPVMFLEPKRNYRTIKEELPENDGAYLPPGVARTVVEGTQCTVIAWGAMVQIATEAAALATEKGMSVEVIDLRTLVPMDVDSILASVRKTGRAVIVHEAPRTCGVGAEIAALIADGAIESLEAPILRVTGFDTPFPYALEHVYLPNADRVLAAVDKAIHF